MQEIQKDIDLVKGFMSRPIKEELRKEAQGPIAEMQQNIGKLDEKITSLKLDLNSFKELALNQVPVMGKSVSSQAEQHSTCVLKDDLKLLKDDLERVKEKMQEGLKVSLLPY